MGKESMVDLYIFIEGEFHSSKKWHFLPCVGDEIMLFEHDNPDLKIAHRVVRRVFGYEGQYTLKDMQAVNIDVVRIED